MSAPNIEWVQLPSSSIVFKCPTCEGEIECEVKLFGRTFVEEGGQAGCSVRPEVDDQPVWDHILFTHTSILE